jgi:hypothetical protein
MARRLCASAGGPVLRRDTQMARKDLHRKFAPAELCRSSEQSRTRLALAIHVVFISLNAS